MRFISLFAWTLATVAASPVPESEGGGLEERAVASTCRTNKAYGILSSAGPRGSIYCSSVLSLTAATVLTTAPPSRITVWSCPTGLQKAGVAQAKRDEGSPLLEERQDGLAALGAGQITAGCKCLSLPPKTVTSTLPPTTTITVNTRNKPTCTA